MLKQSRRIIIDTELSYTKQYLNEIYENTINK